MNVSDIFTTLIPIIKNAGEIILSASSDKSFDKKSGTANFVTAYDVAVQNYLMENIKKEIPNALFIAEEKDNDNSALDSECCFIIDPIDGTTNFIHDYRHSCISVAMVNGGECVLGIIYDPYQNEIFHAIKGKGAYLNGKAICVSDTPFELAVVLFGSAPYDKPGLADKTFAFTKELFLKTSDIRRSGSAALDLAYLACGRCDIFFEFMLSPWDFAAGQLLVTEAGGVITDARGQKPSLASKTPIFAATPKNHEELIKTAQKYL